MCGRLEPPLAVGASQVGQRTSLLEPSAQRRLDVAVDVSEEEMINDSLTNVMVKRSQPGGGQTQDNDNKKKLILLPFHMNNIHPKSSHL